MPNKLDNLENLTGMSDVSKYFKDSQFQSI